MTRPRWNARGFSLIEAMVALGLLAVGVYVVATTMRNGAVGQKTIQAQDDARVLTENMASMLSNAQACANTFAGKVPGNAAVNPSAGGTITNVFDNATPPNARFTTNQVYGNRGAKLFAITVGGSGTDAKTNLPRWEATGTNGGTALAVVDWLQTGNNASTGPLHLMRYFIVYVTALNEGKIQACTAQAVASVSLGSGNANFITAWKDNGNSLMNSTIYEDPASQHIGIGTTNPAASLDVNGPVKLGSGTTNAGCSAQGSLAFDYGANSPVYCNGTIWVGMNGSSGNSGSGGLLNGIHTVAQCEGAGGSANGNLCQFGTSSCPGGWTKDGNWGSTAPKACNGVAGTAGYNENCGSTCTTGSHSFANLPPETCSYVIGSFNSWLGCTNRSPATCTASVSGVGCY